MQRITTGQDASPDMAYKNRYLIMAIILTGIFMSVLDSIVVSIALPAITIYFNVSLVQAQWTITAYLLTITSLLIIFGKVSEYMGKVNLFIVGYAIFTVGSLACGLSSGMGELILFRVVQAIGGAIVYGGSGGILYQAFPASERGRAMGFLGSTIAVGAIAGPVLGGFIVYAVGWQYIFLINVPIGIVLLAAALKYMKINEVRSKSLNLDWIGAILLIIFMASLVMLLEEVAAGTALTIPAVVYGALFILFLAAFILRESACKEPVLDLSMFRDKKFTLPIVSMGISFVATFMMALVGPFYFMGVMHFNALQVGLVSMCGPVIVAIGSPISGWLYDRGQSRYMSAAGMLITAAALFLLSFAQLYASLGLILASLVIQGIGSALFQSPNSTESLSARPMNKVAMAMSVSSTARNLGMVLGTTIATALVAIQLSGYGYSGPVLDAGAYDLTHTVSTVTFGAAALCVLGAITSLLRNVSLPEIRLGLKKMLGNGGIDQ